MRSSSAIWTDLNLVSLSGFEFRKRNFLSKKVISNVNLILLFNEALESAFLFGVLRLSLGLAFLRRGSFRRVLVQGVEETARDREPRAESEACPSPTTIGTP